MARLKSRFCDDNSRYQILIACVNLYRDYYKTTENNCFSVISSSPEPKAQVSFSDEYFTVVRHRWCCRCHKLFTVSSSSPEPLNQFQPNLTQIILGLRGFNFFFK